MKIAPIPSNEKERLAALISYEILDTSPDDQFDEITKLAADYCETPIALISLIDEARQWFKSRVGLEVQETHRNESFCSHVILGNETMVVNDTHLDERFSDNPLVVSPPDIRFYAGAPLTTPDGYNIGTLCVIDTKARTLNDRQKFALEMIARIVMKELELRKVLNNQKEFEKKLIEAKQEAEAAAAAKSEFLSTMSHEIRTPLNAIVGISYLLLEEDPKPEQIENINTLASSAENLLTLVNDILDFSKIEAGKLTLERTTFSLELLLTNVVKMLNFRALDKGINLTLDFDSNIPSSLLGDSVRITQIITNLVSNAVKFTNYGGASVKARLLSTLDNEVVIYFEVKDTGIGIPKEQVGKIFESFTQAAGNTTRKYGGSGLGLTITRKLLQFMGTDISLKSEFGVGSTFHFELRLGISANNNKTHTILPETFHSNLAGAKVLVAEDNPINVIIIKKFLTKWGVEPDVAVNGKEAVQMASETEYELILMDIQMPEMDGYEAAKTIRKLDNKLLSTVPIIALTAASVTDVWAEVLEAGMNDAVSKPFNPVNLKEKMVLRLQQRAND